MKALTKSQPGHGLDLCEQPDPQVRPGEVIIEVQRASICGTDLHIYEWDPWAAATIDTPRIIGHEFWGTIAELGPGVSSLQLGQRVAVEGHVTCGACRNCRAGARHLCRETEGIGIHRDGGFAQYVAVPAGNVFVLSDAITDDIASVLDPFGNAVHTALSYDLVGEDVLITGAGAIGVMACGIARHCGARHIVVTDLSAARLQLAKEFGASATVQIPTDDLQATRTQLGLREGFDIGFEMSGSAKALGQMIEQMNHGGRMAWLGVHPDGVDLDANAVIFKSLQIKGIYGRQMFDTWYKMQMLIEGGLRLDPVITKTVSALEFEKGFGYLRDGQPGKVVLRWDQLAANSWHEASYTDPV